MARQVARVEQQAREQGSSLESAQLRVRSEQEQVASLEARLQEEVSEHKGTKQAMQLQGKEVERLRRELRRNYQQHELQLSAVEQKYCELLKEVAPSVHQGGQ